MKFQFDTCPQCLQPQPLTLPPANSPTMHSRLVCQAGNVCLGEPAYLQKKLFFKRQSVDGGSVINEAYTV